MDGAVFYGGVWCTDFYGGGVEAGCSVAYGKVAECDVFCVDPESVAV